MTKDGETDKDLTGSFTRLRTATDVQNEVDMRTLADLAGSIAQPDSMKMELAMKSMSIKMDCSPALSTALDRLDQDFDSIQRRLQTAAKGQNFDGAVKELCRSLLSGTPPASPSSRGPK